MVLPLEDLGLSNMLVYWHQPFGDVLVLVLVEILEFLRLVGFFVESNGTVTVSLSGGVGAYEVDFAVRLQLP